MIDFKGGRGKRVTYKTVMYRIPAPIKPAVVMFGYAYRLLVDSVADPTAANLIERVKNAIAAAGYEHESIPPATLQANDLDSDSDDSDSDSDVDDDYDETDEETIINQSKEIKILKEQLKDSRIDTKLEECKLADVQKLRSQLDDELNQLHATNGDLNLKISNLEEKLAEVERSKDDVELEVSYRSKVSEAVDILKNIDRMKTRPGSAIKLEVEKALKLLKPLY